MAFGNGNGAASPAQGTVAQKGLGWADSGNRVVTVLVLGVPLVAIAAFSTTTGYTFLAAGLTGSTPATIPTWANAQFRGLSLVADVGFLFLFVVLAAVSEGAGSLSVAILAAIWFAYILAHGSGILKAGTTQPASPAGPPAPVGPGPK